jgi:hypothetical protein
MVRIVQHLCPKRHCLLVLGYEEGQSTFEKCVAMMKDMEKTLKMNPHCGICGSTDLFFEEGVTKFNTMAEAAPHMQELAGHNLLTRLKLDAAGQTYDKMKLN